MKRAFACAAAMAAMFTASAAWAQDADVAFNVGVFSDYVFRGFSQTNEDPALQGGVDLTVGSFYAGAWASNVDFGDDTDAEIDVYGGFRTEAAGYALDFGVVGYFYVNAPGGADYDYVEFKAAASRAIGPVTAGAVVYYSPDFFGLDEEATYVEGNLAWAFADKWAASGALGYQALDVNDDYTTWNAGVTNTLVEGLGLDVRYFDTDKDGPLSDDRIVGSLKYSF